MLKIQDLSLFFFNNKLNVDVKPGEVLGLVGPSGSGKTTLLKSIKGFINRFSGSIQLDDTILSEKEAVRNQKLAFVHQSSNVFLHWNVIENIILPDIYVNHTPDAIARKKMKEICEKLSLSHILKKEVKNLSIGEKQRLSIVRAQMMNPSVILMDEPSSALDPVNVKNLQFLIKSLSQEGQIFIITSHDMHFMRTVCDKIVFINDCNVHFNGKAEDFWNNSKDETIINFVNY